MSFALLTGASKGIGRAMAQQLAAKKIDLLLVARNESELAALSGELQAAHGITAHFLAVDLSKAKAAEVVFNWCRGNNYKVQYLINNAGYGMTGRFEEAPLEDYLAMMHVNMNAVVELSHFFLPQLKEQERSYILNIASSAAYQAVPYLGVYAASKSFVLQFTRALRYELRKTPVSVTCVSPGSTKTNFDSRAGMGPKALKAASKVAMQPDEVARIAIDTMLKGKPEIVVGLLNKLGAAFVWLLPKNLVENTAAKIYE